MKNDNKILAVIQRGADAVVLPQAVMYGDEWLASSALQKSVRRGDSNRARLSGLALWQRARSSFWRRLATIAVEDVGIADVDAVVQCLVAYNNPAWRAETGDLAVGLYLIERVCRATKSRLADEICTALPLYGEYASLRCSLQKATDDKLAQIILNTERPLHSRCLALWLLAGTGKFPSDQLKPRRGNPGMIVDVMQEIGGDLDLIHSCIDAVYKTPWPLVLITPLLASFMRQTTDPLSEIKEAFPETREFETVPFYALDQFTRVGKAAIRQFQKAIPDLKPFTSEAVGMAIFYQEGGKVNRYMTNKILADYTAVGACADLEGCQVKRDDQLGLRECVSANMEILGDFRRAQLVQYFHGSQSELQWVG